MQGGPSGFVNAPVTRAIVFASGVLTLFFRFRGRSVRLLGLTYQDIFNLFRLWRIFSVEFVFSSTPELMFGLYLIYYFRLFERQIGSNKYSVFVLFSLTTSLLFEVVALAFLKDPTTALASGPYGLIFASFIPFYLDIPVSSRFHMFGIHFTDKSFIYLAGLQLLLSSWKRSFVPGISGVLAGALYCANAFNIRRIKFPESIASFFSRFSWSSGSSPRSRNGVRNFTPHAGRQVEAT
ncbi:rhomboid-like protein 20 [Iris pallida]|uniref:Rhomboid-like protein 20 n=1 Tax=Iris pallida TaxID=29817 RepID=A0AAX6IHJ9_IRIPA|nr:rhomboid-like protein 20 [Iris pallida]